MSRPHTPSFQLRRPNLPQGNPNGPSGLGTGGRTTPTLGRATVSLEEWERQAPLSDEQQGRIREVSAVLEERALPEKVRIRQTEQTGHAHLQSAFSQCQLG